jgi:glycine/D-amino acid oxidase-like deaminating enzyme
MTDILIIGGGIVGSAIAYGLVNAGKSVTLLDGDDTDHRAARANFGLVWLQGKGLTMPEYHLLTRRSIDAWSGFNEGLERRSGTELAYERKGGLQFCLSEADFEERRMRLQRLHNVIGASETWEMLERGQLERLMPRVAFGPEVVGASYGFRDGHCNPLRLLSAMQGSIVAGGGRIVSGARVSTLRHRDGTFEAETPAGSFSAPKVVLSAGLGTAELARQVGLDIALHPERGEILVTERCENFLPLPCSGLRQTGEGTVMIGATKARVGLDSSTTGGAAASLASKAARIIPKLAQARVVRQWAGLRVMTQDGFPVYAQSTDCPGAFVALCHSGVTLAAFHATELADAIAAGALPESLSPFHQGRFDVPQAA